MKKKDIDQLIKDILSRHKVGDRVKEDQIFKDLLSISPYNHLLEKEDLRFEIKNYRIKGTFRRVKMVCPVFDKTTILFFSKTKWLSFFSKTKSKTSQRSKIFQALRNDIDYQMQEKKDSLGYVCYCEESGDKIFAGSYDIDHEPSFLELVDKWLEKENLYLEEILISGRNSAQRKLKKRELAKSWQKFHQENANLRVVKKSLNRSLGSKGYSFHREKRPNE